jgi:hypothetical protein
MKKSFEPRRTAGFQPATPLNSIEAGKSDFRTPVESIGLQKPEMPALHWASR